MILGLPFCDGGLSESEVSLLKITRDHVKENSDSIIKKHNLPKIEEHFKKSDKDSKEMASLLYQIIKFKTKAQIKELNDKIDNNKSKTERLKRQEQLRKQFASKLKKI